MIIGVKESRVCPLTWIHHCAVSYDGGVIDNGPELELGETSSDTSWVQYIHIHGWELFKSTSFPQIELK